jgi:hypothetical protein
MSIHNLEFGIIYRIHVNPPIVGYDGIQHHEVLGELVNNALENPFLQGNTYIYRFFITDVHHNLIPGEAVSYLNQNNFTAVMEGGKRKKKRKTKRRRSYNR